MLIEHTVIFAEKEGRLSNQFFQQQRASSGEGLERHGETSTDRSGGWQPQINFSPPANWLNDPNGLFVDPKGVWHMYYQCEFVPPSKTKTGLVLSVAFQ
jgi:sucrose-6-phosphate hydrolase SacC (GH32 family)